jgi:hypothetical protein
MPAQSVSPDWQDKTQVPALHTSPDEQEIPHPPQCMRSVVRSVHHPKQSVCPGWQLMAH